MSRFIAPHDRAAVWDRDAGICWLCGDECDARGWDIDHVMPRDYDGDDHLDNLAPAHPVCNRSRPRRLSDEDIEEIAEKLTENVLARLLPADVLAEAMTAGLPDGIALLRARFEDEPEDRREMFEGAVALWQLAADASKASDDA